MKTKIMLCVMVLLLALFTGSAFGFNEGVYNTSFGDGAGANIVAEPPTWYDTFIGVWAGHDNTIGQYNTYLGYYAGAHNLDGISNTFVGYLAGENGNGSGNTLVGSNAGLNCWGNRNVMVGEFAGLNNHGWNNVFIGWNAAADEEASDRLYIANSDTSTPLIYGEFDNNLLRINGSGHFSGLGVSKSQLHFSLDNTDTGGWLTSVLDNNFWLSSGAIWDNSLGGWVQKSADNLAVMVGSGSVGYRVFTRSGCPVGTACTPTPRLWIDYSGNVGLGIAPAHPLHLVGGAYSDGASWINGSSREYKDDIESLNTGEALETIRDLNPVKFAYKTDTAQKRVGFIAEDVPELVATKDRKGLSPMDIVAVLTKVVQDQQKTIQEQQVAGQKQQAVIDMLMEKLTQLEGKIESLRTRGILLSVLSQK